MIGLAAILLGCLIVIGAGGSRDADAEIVTRGSLRAVFDAQLDPAVRPRYREVPVRFGLSGRIRQRGGGPLPQLDRLEIAINPNGRVTLAGLPRCPYHRIEDGTHQLALDVCGSALVGRGRFSGLLALPDQELITSRGTLLAFNSSYRGRRAIVGHVFSRDPVRLSYSIPILVDRGGGRRPMRLFTPPLSRLLGQRVHAISFSFELARRFRHRGQVRSLLSAACPAPRGFPGGVFKLATVTYRFTEHRPIRHSLARTCRVR